MGTRAVVAAGDQAAAYMARFGLSETGGFVPIDRPIRRLPEAFAAWESIVEDLSALLAARALRPRVENLQNLNIELLASESERERAFFVLALMTQAYIWGEVPVAEVLKRNRIESRPIKSGVNDHVTRCCPKISRCHFAPWPPLLTGRPSLRTARLCSRITSCLT